ncbi:M50 family metallopeptidase [Streptomyces wuyuanensis]|uniref:Putative peptide zinc metalloprotease protein n=1 Tax=Streptomyces wuyuanensis TaxID=1196353 RepID=A0A1G9U068_9ACTN|nr:M50 family metallopeptidase [Streptomyces wuyuanensis]SDM53261.1 putative peptide zinc metalloprotease protein [Streptomyces wuyuanensis]
MTAPAVPARYRPALRPGVLLSEPLLHGPDLVHLIRNTGSGQSFRIGPREHFLISRMDGTRTLEEIGADYAARFGRRLGDSHWHSLLALLGTRDLLAGRPGSTDPPDGTAPGGGAPKALAPSPAAAPAAPPGTEPRAPRGLLRGTVRLVGDADATATRLHRATRHLLSPVALLPLLALTVLMEVTLLLRIGELLDDTAALFTAPALLLAVATLLWLSTALHELAHGVLAHHHGGRVSEIGLRWRLPVVIMYCTVDDFLHLPRRRGRIATAGAGAAMNLLFLLPFFAVWALAPLDHTTRQALGALLLLGSVQAFTMLLPLPPLDGYRIAAQILGATSLAASTAAYLRLRLRRAPAAAGYPRRARRAYAAYGAAVALTLVLLAAAASAVAHHYLTTAR